MAGDYPPKPSDRSAIVKFFRGQYEQWRTTFVDMPPQSRWMIGLLIVAIAIGGALLFRDSMTVAEQALLGGRSFNDEEMTQMELAFSRSGLNGARRDGTRIVVPREQRAEYLAALADNASLPLSVRSNVEEAMEKMSVFESSQMREMRQQHAREQDLAQAIAAFNDIREARVFHSVGQRIGLSRHRSQRAMVHVKPVGNSPLSRDLVRTIQQMVAGHYSDMDAQDVNVTDSNGGSSADLDDDNPLLRAQRDAEMLAEQKVRALLASFPAQIVVSAEVDPSMDVQTTMLKYDAEPTTLATESSKVESLTTQMRPGGEPGAVPNAIGTRAATLDEPAETRRVESDDRASRSVTGGQYEERRSANFQVRSLQISVGLPTSYYEKLHVKNTLRSNPDTDPADVPPIDPQTLDQLKIKTRTQIQSALTPVLPKIAAGADPSQYIQVWDYEELAEPETEPARATADALTWLAESWQTIALFALGLAALLIARSTARAAASPPSEFNEGFGLELPEPPAAPETDEGDNMTITGTSLQQELNAIVESNPEVAANVIRSWIGEAA